MKYLIAQQIRYSQVFNPYVEKDAVLLRAHAVHSYKLQKRVYDATDARNIISRIINRRNIPERNMPMSFDASISNTVHEKDVPVWDITFVELKNAYNKARFDPYLKDDSFIFIPNLINKCSSRFFKRRIPWLYPDNGKLRNPVYKSAYY